MSQSASSFHSKSSVPGQGPSISTVAGRNGIGKETGFPLILCPACGLARVIELRSKKDNNNFGRVFFKCPRNGVPQSFEISYL